MLRRHTKVTTKSHRNRSSLTETPASTADASAEKTIPSRMPCAPKPNWWRMGQRLSIAAVAQGYKPLAARRTDADAVRARVLELYGIPAAGLAAVPAIDSPSSLRPSRAIGISTSCMSKRCSIRPPVCPNAVQRKRPSAICCTPSVGSCNLELGPSSASTPCTAANARRAWTLCLYERAVFLAIDLSGREGRRTGHLPQHCERPR